MDIEYKKYKDTHLVYNDGRVYSLISNKFLKFDYSNSGYARIKLNGKSVRVHRLVMELFKGPSDLTVDHIDGNKLNNSLDNLEYVTREENLIRSWKTGSRNIQRLKQKERLEKPVIWNGILFESGIALSKKLGRCESYVSQKIKRNKPINGFKVEFI